MNKKNALKKTAALLLGLALAVGATGCNFIVTNNEADLKQTVATVDITATLEKDALYGAKSAELDKILADKGMTTSIPKRDLIAYFLSVGMTYIQNYGYTYEATINMLMDGLVNRKIMSQYAVAYYLNKNSALTATACKAYVDGAIANATGKEKTLLSNHRDVLTMKYFLTENGTDEESYNKAVYSLMSSLNASLDSAESGYITANEDSHTHSETRTTPTNANTAKTDYVPMKEGKVDYDIYTGRNAVDSCGTYEKVSGSTASTRKKAYNTFLSNLQSYGLIKDEEDTADIKLLDYYYIELSSSLEQALISKLYEDLKEDAIATLAADDYAYVKAKYEDIKEAQQYTYTNDATAFDTALDGVSKDSFVLYGEKDFGFIYNILLPFSASQNMAYNAAKNNANNTQDDIYNARKALLAQIEAKDLRSAWFCEEDSAENYSYEVTDGYFNVGMFEEKKSATTTPYLFFENNVKKTDQYEALSQYAGQYPYNGEAKYEDGEWTFTPNKVTIDSFLTEMESYIDYTVGGDVANAVAKDWKTAYEETTTYTDENDVVDFSKFIYYEGRVELTNKNRADYFNKEKNGEKNDSYAALSAVNELMFAYSTDTGCLNTYMGYVVSPYKTDFVSEFEYAAQYAVKKGVGTYVVAPSDYGWHIIYVAFVYDADDGDVYGGLNIDDIKNKNEGTFSYLFYESLKSTTATNYTTEKENAVLNVYKGSATRFVKAYEDLLELDK
ncbi:MAG: hypothetical protein IJX88_04710 [Clostridia bacterium]|nr:hypothetical protein [Clostridia bacterium]